MRLSSNLKTIFDFGIHYVKYQQKNENTHIRFCLLNYPNLPQPYKENIYTMTCSTNLHKNNSKSEFEKFLLFEIFSLRIEFNTIIA